MLSSVHTTWQINCESRTQPWRFFWDANNFALFNWNSDKLEPLDGLQMGIEISWIFCINPLDSGKFWIIAETPHWNDTIVFMFSGVSISQIMRGTLEKLTLTPRKQSWRQTLPWRSSVWISRISAKSLTVLCQKNFHIRNITSKLKTFLTLMFADCSQESVEKDRVPSLQRL